MSASQWQPGYNKVPRNLKPKPFHRHVAASLTMGPMSGVLYEGPYNDMQTLLSSPGHWTAETGTTVLISLKYGSLRTGVLLDLSSMSEDELNAFEAFVLEAVKRARPSVLERDAIAREAENNGDFGYERSSKTSPRLVVQPRKIE